MPPSHLVIDPRTRGEIEALVVEHAWLIDNHQSERLADLYTEDGRLLGVGPDKIGREALLAYGRDRAKMTKRTARHVVSNLRLIPESPKRIRGSNVVTLFRADGEAIATADPIGVADSFEIYVQGDDGRWRIAERKIVIVFESEAHKAG
nr:nuclear transport factor 2 family protein [Nitrosomonas nitrosa]